MREVNNSDETLRVVCWIYKTGLAISKSVAHKQKHLIQNKQILLVLIPCDIRP